MRDSAAPNESLAFLYKIVEVLQTPGIDPGTMVITVVIPTYNRRESLTHCLESLFQQTYPRDQYEINIVVDGSTDGTAEYLSKVSFPCALSVIRQDNRGQASARNAGIRAAKGSYVLILDDDFVCDPKLIEEHVRAHIARDSVVVGPILLDENVSSLPALAVDREIRPYYERYRNGQAPAAWFPPNSSLRRELMLAAGGYDEQLGNAREDTELGLRLLDRGTEFQFLESAVVHQRHRKSAADLVRDAAQFGKNDVRLLRKRADYLQHCNLSQIAAGPSWKRLARRVIALSPISPELFCAGLYLAVEPLKSTQSFREFGIRLLNVRRYVAWLRAAVVEAGGWKPMCDMIERTRNTASRQTA